MQHKLQDKLAIKSEMLESNLILKDLNFSLSPLVAVIQLCSCS